MTSYANLLILLFISCFLIAVFALWAHSGIRGTSTAEGGFSMLRGFSDRLRENAHCKVRQALRENGIVNIIRLAEEIRLKNLEENFAREDIETLVMQVARLYGAPIEFDEQALAALDLPDACPADSRNDLEKALNERAPPEVQIDLLHLDSRA
ncbi:hypothetical protein EOD23_06600 [Mesorhizobium sp. USDA-HM6]|nr:hypothetical protein EOD23_06600 [Mesorhizobium sp. USDA-HM6]